MKVRKKLIFLSTYEGRSMDHRLLFPNRVKNLAYPYKKVDIHFVSGRERVGPHWFSHMLTLVVPRMNKRANYCPCESILDMDLFLQLTVKSVLLLEHDPESNNVFALHRECRFWRRNGKWRWGRERFRFTKSKRRGEQKSGQRYPLWKKRGKTMSNEP